MGKYRAWYVICTPIIPRILYINVFDMGDSMGAAAIVIIAFCIKTLFQDVVSAAVTGHISQITDDSDTRTLLSARRNQGAVIGQLLFSLLGIPCITLFGKLFGNTAAGYTGAAFFFCLVNAITHYIMFVLTKDAPSRQPNRFHRAVSSLSEKCFVFCLRTGRFWSFLSETCFAIRLSSW